MTVLRTGVIYFAMVFAVGFVLGFIRTLWLAPAVGQRASEFIEMPFMVIASFVAASIVVHRMDRPSRRQCVMLGVTAFCLLLLAECAVVLGIRRESLGESIAGRDPISGSVYVIALLIFAAAPALIRHRAARHQSVAHARSPLGS